MGLLRAGPTLYPISPFFCLAMQMLSFGRSGLVFLEILCGTFSATFLPCRTRTRSPGPDTNKQQWELGRDAQACSFAWLGVSRLNGHVLFVRLLTKTYSDKLVKKHEIKKWISEDFVCLEKNHEYEKVQNFKKLDKFEKTKFMDLKIHGLKKVHRFWKKVHKFEKSSGILENIMDL